MNEENGLTLLKATGQDWANHIARLQDSSANLHMVIQFDSQLDEDLLRLAFLKTLETQPVLGCRFDELTDQPYWMEQSPEQICQAFTVEESADAGVLVKQFVEEEELENGIQIRIHLIRADEGDTLCLKLDHACCDGGGLKAYLLLLYKAYNLQHAAGSRPSEEASMRDSLQTPPERSTNRVFEACGIMDIRQAYRHDKDTPADSVPVPFTGAFSNQVRYESLSFPLAEIRSKASDITVNDQLLTAYARVLSQLNPSSSASDATTRLSIQMTLDLRRYLKQEEAPIVCNLSGMERISLSITKSETYADTLQKVHEEVRLIKSSNPGLHSAASMELLSRMTYPKAKEFLLQAGARVRASGKSVPLLSNLGVLSTNKLQFGECTALSIYAITPAMHASAFMLGASSYDGTLTLVCAYFELERTQADIKGMLHLLKKELSATAE
jgi:NRPS condensation-like uncharacterized protein